MSFLTGTNVETIYASTAAGATLSTFTTEALLNTTATMGVQAHLPPDFWLPNRAQAGRGIRIVARGILSTTGTPTYTFTIRSGAANQQTASILLGSAAITAGSGVTNQYWEIQGDVILTSIAGAGTNSTVQGVGYVMSSGFPTPNFIQPMYGGAASPGTVATVDTSVTNYINVDVACGTSSASNSVTLNQLLVFGLN